MLSGWDGGREECQRDMQVCRLRARREAGADSTRHADVLEVLLADVRRERRGEVVTVFWLILVGVALGPALKGLWR